MDGSDKFSRELVESGVLDYIKHNDDFKTYTKLNRRNPVTDNDSTFRGSVKKRFDPEFNKEYGGKIESFLKELEKIGKENREK